MSSGKININSISPMFLIKRKWYNVTAAANDEAYLSLFEPLTNYSLIGIVGLSQSIASQRFRKWRVFNGSTGQMEVALRNSTSSKQTYSIVLDLLYLKNST